MAAASAAMRAEVLESAEWLGLLMPRALDDAAAEAGERSSEEPVACSAASSVAIVRAWLSSACVVSAARACVGRAELLASLCPPRSLGQAHARAGPSASIESVQAAVDAFVALAEPVEADGGTEEGDGTGAVDSADTTAERAVAVAPIEACAWPPLCRAVSPSAALVRSLLASSALAPLWPHAVTATPTEPPPPPSPSATDLASSKEEDREDDGVGDSESTTEAEVTVDVTRLGFHDALCTVLELEPSGARTGAGGGRHSRAPVSWSGLPQGAWDGPDALRMTATGSTAGDGARLLSEGQAAQAAADAALEQGAAPLFTMLCSDSEALGQPSRESRASSASSDGLTALTAVVLAASSPSRPSLHSLDSHAFLAYGAADATLAGHQRQLAASRPSLLQH
jgi:hypothetical protein